MFAIRSPPATTAAILARFYKLAGQFYPFYENLEPKYVSQNQEYLQALVVKFTKHNDCIDVVDNIANTLRDVAPLKRGAVVLTDNTPESPKTNEGQTKAEATRAAILARFYKLAGQFYPFYENLDPKYVSQNQEYFQALVVKFTKPNDCNDVVDNDNIANPLRDVAPLKRDAVVLTENLLEAPKSKEGETVAVGGDHGVEEEEDKEEFKGEWRDVSYHRSLLGGTHLGGI